MKRPLAVAVLLGIVTHTPVRAAEFSGYINLTTDYVFRGVTYSDGKPAAQFGLDADFDSGIFVGAYASTIDIDNGAGRQRDLEVILYGGYGLPLHDDWHVSATIVAYTYPGATGNVDYDYEELSLAVNYRDRLWLEYAYSPDLYHTGYDTHNVEGYAEWSLPWHLTGGAGIGWYDTSALSGYSYSYWQAGVTRPAGPVDLDLRYHDTGRSVPIISTEERASSRIVLSLRFQF